jgi:hypothetical protein
MSMLSQKEPNFKNYLKEMKMKKYILLMLFCLMNKSAISQNNNDYFPLSVGNYWVYIIYDHNVSEYTDSFFVKVLGIEKKENNKSYFAVSESNSKFSDTPNRYYRIDDSSNVFEYYTTINNECLQYKLGVKYGDTWQSCDLLSSTTYGMMNFQDTLLLPDRKVIQFFDTIPHIPYTNAIISFFFDKGVGISRMLIRNKNITNYLKRYFFPTNGVEKERIHEPDLNYRLSNNYPNPFNPSTNIKITLEHRTKIILTVYDLIGRRIKTLFEGDCNSGDTQFAWNGKDDNNKNVSSGVYCYRISIMDKNGVISLSEIKKMTLMR